MCVVVASYSKPDLFVLLIILSFSSQRRFVVVDFFKENTCSYDIMFNNNNNRLSLFVANNYIPKRLLQDNGVVLVHVARATP